MVLSIRQKYKPVALKSIINIIAALASNGTWHCVARCHQRWQVISTTIHFRPWLRRKVGCRPPATSRNMAARAGPHSGFPREAIASSLVAYKETGAGLVRLMTCASSNRPGAVSNLFTRSRSGTSEDLLESGRLAECPQPLLENSKAPWRPTWLRSPSRPGVLPLLDRAPCQRSAE